MAKERTINIPQQLYRDVDEFCSLSKKKPEEYIILCIRKQLAVDKYGDLNEKVNKEPPKTEIKKTEPIETPKPVVLEKKVEERKKDVPEKTDEVTLEQKKVETTEPNISETEETPVKRHRTIKTK